MRGFTEHPIGSDDFSKFNDTGARMQDFIYHMTIKSHSLAIFAPNILILPLENVTFYGR